MNQQNTDQIFIKSTDSLCKYDIGVDYNHSFTEFRNEYSILTIKQSAFILDYMLLENAASGSILKINIQNESEFDRFMKAHKFKYFGLEPYTDFKPQFQVLELRITGKLVDKERVTKILDFCKYNSNSNSNSNLRDLELNVTNNATVLMFLEALKSNYDLKTLRLLATIPASKGVLAKVIEFKRQRVALDFQLNTKGKSFKSTKNRISEIYYPYKF